MHKLKTKRILLSVLASVALFCDSASAQIVNGDFAGGSLAGWSIVTGSDVSTDTVTPGDFFANVSSPNTPGFSGASLSDVATSFGFSDGGAAIQAAINASITATRTGGPFDPMTMGGSGLFQTFTATAGDTIVFEMNHNKNTTTLRDFGFGSLRLVGAGTAPVLVAGSNSVVNGEFLEFTSTGFLAEPGAGLGGAWLIQTTGTYTLGFGIFSTNSNSTATNVGVDLVAAIPEVNAKSAAVPVAIAILVLFLVSDGRARRGFRLVTSLGR